jgi:hypothetical protein
VTVRCENVFYGHDGGYKNITIQVPSDQAKQYFAGAQVLLQLSTV